MIKKKNNKESGEKKPVKKEVTGSKKDEVKNKKIKKEVRKEPKKEKRVKKIKEASKPKKTKRKSKRKSKSSKKVAIARGKRKTAIARARVKEGKGNVRINKNSLSSISNIYLKELISEPIELAGDKALQVDIYVNVYGGGVLGQAQAVRTAIARALVNFFDDSSLKNIYTSRDKFILVEDSRRVESKKFKGRKARARFQKSYR